MVKVKGRFQKKNLWNNKRLPIINERENKTN